MARALDEATKQTYSSEISAKAASDAVHASVAQFRNQQSPYVATSPVPSLNIAGRGPMFIDLRTANAAEIAVNVQAEHVGVSPASNVRTTFAMTIARPREEIGDSEVMPISIPN
jgi:hypothetical protein